MVKKYNTCCLLINSKPTILIILFFIAMYSSTIIYASPAKPVVVISIDAETTRYGFRNISLPDQFDLKIGDVYCGITKMMDICDKHNVKATFFLNVYEHKEYGESVLKEIAKLIDEKGFDVQLHTHPQWAYDKKRNLMCQYSLNEQIEIIKDGKNSIKKWINKDTLIHRAGAYGANEDTLKALYANNIFFDSSFYIPRSPLKTLDLKTNYISRHDGVYQIPVNTFIHEEHATCIDFLEPRVKMAKYDIDMLTYDTMIKAIDEGIKQHFDVIVLFLHSFSFISNYSEKNKEADIVDINEFDNVLDYINKRGLRIVTFSSFINEFDQRKHIMENSDYIPTISTRINIFKLLAIRARIQRRDISRVIAYASVVLIISAIILAYFMVRIKKQNTTRSIER